MEHLSNFFLVFPEATGVFLQLLFKFLFDLEGTALPAQVGGYRSQPALLVGEN